MATAVPNTNTFSLQDVIAVVGGNDLTTAFSNSNAAYFNATYGSKTAPNSMYEFRDYKPTTTGFSFVSSKSVSGASIVSIDISDNGQYMYMIVVNGTNSVDIRRYTLGTAYDLSTMGTTYQTLSLNSLVQWNGDNMGCRSISFTNGHLYFMYSRFVYDFWFNTAYDLTSWTGFSVTELEISVHYFPYDLYLTGSYFVTSGDGNIDNSGEGTVGNNTAKTYNVSYPHSIYTTQSRGYFYASGRGLEFNSSGSKYYVMGNYNTAKLIEFPSNTNFTPTGSNVNKTNEWDLSATVTNNPDDFCFSDNIGNMYVLASNTIYQFTLPSL